MKRILLNSLNVILLGTISATSLYSQVFTTNQNIGGIINTYSAVTNIPNSNTLTVTNTSSFSTCDKVLIIQMKGATISTTDDATFGDITAIGNAGNYEEIYIGSITGNDITFQSNFINSYDVSGLVQVISIPQYTAGASITSDLTCQAWNGTTGGVLIFEATDLYLGHQINVSGLGFRKGEENGANLDHCQITDVSPSYDYATPVSDIKAAEKGEGIVVEASLLHGRGKLASGGGGGNVHNGGGGGGSNYGSGGLGGYAAMVCSPSPAAQIEGQGIGGEALSAHYGYNKIFMGGAGGAGQGNNNSSAPSFPNAQNDFNYGGNGGGIIIAKVDQLIIDWSTAWEEWFILADGENAPQNTGGDTPVLYDGAGGGGAGGTIILEIGSIDNQTGDAARNPVISATGGIGGYNMNGSADCYAPGGGGGGGVIAWLSASQPTNIQSVSFNEGAAGQKNPAQSCPGSYGATDGTTGTEMFNFTIPLGTTTSIPPSVSIVEDQNNVCAGTTINFTATPTNGGASPSYQWLVNGGNVGTDSPTFSSSSLADNDTVNVIITTSGSCGTPLSDTSDKITMIINPVVVPTVTISEDTNNVCTGTNITFTSTVTGEGPSPSYQWQVNRSNVGTDSPTFSSSALANNDDVTLILTSNETCANPTSVTSTPITVLISGSVTPTVSITEDQNNICSGETVVFTATISGGGSTPSFQWLLNGGNIGTDASTFSSSSLSNGDVVGVVLTSSSACASPTTANSNDITVTVNPNLIPSVTISEDQNNVCDGTTINFTSTPTNAGTSPSFQWLVNGNNVGTDSPTYSSSSLGNNDTVNVIVTTSDGCGAPLSDTSDKITMIINPIVVPTAMISEDMNNVCTGTNITFSSTVTGEGSSPSYQWQVNGSNVGTDSPTFSSSTLANNDDVTLILTSNETCANPTSVTSSPITVLMSGSVTPTVSITEDQNNICSGETIVFTASISGGGSTPSFQWLLNGGNIGTDASTFSSSSLGNGDVVGVVLTSSSACASPATVNSNDINVTVNPNLIPSVTISEDQNSVCSGTDITFTSVVTNEGTSPSYQWLVNGSNVGTNSSSFNSTTLSNGDQVSLELTSNAICASPTQVTSNAIDIIINPTLVPTVSISEDQNNVCAGTDITFSSIVSNEGTTPNYQWTLNGANIGTDSPSFNSTTLSDGDQIRLTLTSSEPCSTGPINSNTVDIIINSNQTPTVSITPTTSSICEGKNQSFVATAENAGIPTYQWYVNNSPVGINNNVFSSNTFNNGDIVMVGVKSSLTCGTTDTANSNQVTIIVNPNPTPTISGNNSICEGVSTILTANGGLSGADYSWFLNGSSIGTNSDNLTATSGGNYTVEITNPSTCTGTSLSFSLGKTVISVSAGPDIFMEEGSSVNIQGSSNATMILWNNATTLDNPSSITPNASPLITTTYTITGESNGCTKSDSMTIFITEPILIPNAFTPNSDGENDQWIISGLETYPNAKLQIFNRWGSPVYKTVGTYVPWDGTRSGVPMPVATYYYLLTIDSNEETITGSITLVR